MATRKVGLGPVGHTVRLLIKTIRLERRLRLADLSERLADRGHPLSMASLSQIETGGRRVDVDDLIAIAGALGVNPIELLSVPKTRPPQESASARALEMSVHSSAMSANDADLDRRDAERYRKMRAMFGEVE